jgi:hypothetical protein
MGSSGRPALFTLWTVTVSVIAAAALILSGLALSVAVRGDRSVAGVERSGTHEAAGSGSSLWDADKVRAMEARMLAEAARAQGVPSLWDADKVRAMEARMLAEAARAQGVPSLWDADKVRAMEARMLAG